jgi:two-component system phosphate regulon sensor histidine kinase PhoR
VKFGIRAKLFFILVSIGSLTALAGERVLSSTLDRRLIALLVGALVAFVVAAASTQRAVQILGLLTKMARQMSEGNFVFRARVAGSDELAELGKAIDQLAEDLSARTNALKSERDLLSDIVGATEEGLLLLDAKGRILMANAALRQMLSLGQDVVGKYAGEVIRHPDLQSLLDLARTSGALLPRELELAGIKPRYLLVRSVRIKQTGALLVVFLDLTEMRRLENIRTDFVANVSHELRTPITAIRGYAETLRDFALRDPNAAAGMVDVIFRQSERLSQLVEDLLDLSRIESKEFTIKAEPVRLQDPIRRAAVAVRPKAQSKGIQLDVKVSEGLNATGDERAIEQIVLNLLDNAVKYTPAPGQICLTATSQRGRSAIEVRDTGIGIEEKHIPRLFERFYRVDQGRSREMGGTGLGLAIVKHLVLAMRGQVTVQSTPGKGSTFTVWLPEAMRAEAPALQGP